MSAGMSSLPLYRGWEVPQCFAKFSHFLYKSVRCASVITPALMLTLSGLRGPKHGRAGTLVLIP